MFTVNRDDCKEGSICEISELSRRIKLHHECNNLHKKIKNIVRGKESFIVDLVKSLKKVTDEWRGWKHQVFGGVRSRPYVAAIEQVKELFTWTTNTFKETDNETQISKESYRKFTTETLKNFIRTCAELKNLQLNFHQQVMKPLKEFFVDETSSKYINKIELIQLQWKQLLSPGAIKSCHFSSGSAVFLKEAENCSGFHCFYPVLRLIPDLCFKAEKCLEHVRNCIDTENSKGYRRECNFLLSVWMPQQKRKEREFLENMKTQRRKERSDYIKDRLQCLSTEETQLYGSLEVCKEKLEVLKQDESLLEGQILSNCDNRKKWKKRKADLLGKQVLQSDEMFILQKQLHESKESISDKVWSRSRKDTERHSYERKRNKLISELDHMEKFKQSYMTITDDIEDILRKIENSKNQFEMLQFSYKKVKKQISDLSQNFQAMTMKINNIQKEKRMLKLEQQFEMHLRY